MIDSYLFLYLHNSAFIMVWTTAFNIAVLLLINVNMYTVPCSIVIPADVIDMWKEGKSDREKYGEREIVGRCGDRERRR